MLKVVTKSQLINQSEGKTFIVNLDDKKGTHWALLIDGFLF